MFPTKTAHNHGNHRVFPQMSQQIQAFIMLRDPNHKQDPLRLQIHQARYFLGGVVGGGYA